MCNGFERVENVWVSGLKFQVSCSMITDNCSEFCVLCPLTTVNYKLINAALSKSPKAPFRGFRGNGFQV
jgi:hypothetical protein